MYRKKGDWVWLHKIKMGRRRWDESGRMLGWSPWIRVGLNMVPCDHKVFPPREHSKWNMKALRVIYIILSKINATSEQMLLLHHPKPQFSYNQSESATFEGQHHSFNLWTEVIGFTTDSRNWEGGHVVGETRTVSLRRNPTVFKDTFKHL